MDQKAGGEDTSSLDNTSGSPNKRQGKEKEISSVNPKIFNHKSATRKRTHLYPPTSPHLRQIQSVPPVAASPYLPSEKTEENINKEETKTTEIIMYVQSLKKQKCSR